MVKFKFFIITSLLAFMLQSCATSHSVTEDYQKEIKENRSAYKTSDEMDILILIDGLSLQVLQNALARKAIPSLEKYFSKDNQVRIYHAKAEIPTLTFPNISSILTAESVSEHGINGNRLYHRGKEKNLITPVISDFMRKKLHEDSVFHSLEHSGYGSASFSHPFSMDATAGFPKDLESGVNYALNDYQLIDSKLIRSFNNLLDKTNPPFWPRFAFLHLTGLDSIAHKRSPFHPSVTTYFKKLDALLNPLLKKLELGEKSGKKINVILTADHGFTEIRKPLFLKKKIEKIDVAIDVIEESRYLALYFPRKWDPQAKNEVIQDFSQQNGVRLGIVKEGASLKIFQKGTLGLIESDGSLNCHNDEAPITYQDQTLCPEQFSDLDSKSAKFVGIPAIWEYFQSQDSADALLFAEDGVTFKKTGLGEHGGIDPKEILVPVLTRGVEVQYPGLYPPTYLFLRHLKKL